MKKETTLNFAKISKEQLNELTTTVNETVATDFVPAKIFTVVDLWNIQRKSKPRINGRYLV
ncbi:hypothetical protein [Ferruginibacter sp. SUN106]|uniref:hypothetical protein n=1 Tax=Ferruginibacter sp. SUN106 TaxID=2978348 RepID=UPI003D368D2C